MIFPLGFTSQYEFVTFKQQIGHDRALEFLLNLGNCCREGKTETLCLPDDYIATPMRLPDTLDPRRVKNALLNCRLITPVEGQPDMFHISFFCDHNANLISKWENGAKGGRPKKKITPLASLTAVPATQPSVTETTNTSNQPAPSPQGCDEKLDEDCPF